MVPRYKKSKFASARRALNRANFELDRCTNYLIERARLDDLEDAVKTKKFSAEFNNYVFGKCDGLLGKVMRKTKLLANTNRGKDLI